MINLSRSFLGLNQRFPCAGWSPAWRRYKAEAAMRIFLYGCTVIEDCSRGAIGVP